VLQHDLQDGAGHIGSQTLRPHEILVNKENRNSAAHYFEGKWPIAIVNRCSQYFENFCPRGFQGLDSSPGTSACGGREKKQREQHD
jgi:hypothetical protein